jgi:hypothetical protein
MVEGSDGQQFTYVFTGDGPDAQAFFEVNNEFRDRVERAQVFDEPTGRLDFKLQLTNVRQESAVEVRRVSS